MERVECSYSKWDNIDSLLKEIDRKLKGTDYKDAIVKLNIFEEFDEIDDKYLQNLVEISKQLNAHGLDSAITIKAKDSILNVEEADKLINLEDTIAENNSILMIKGGIYDEYSLKECLLANKKAREFAEHLKAQNLSPFENYLAIYDFLTQRPYNENEEKKYKSRDVISVLNGNNTVCVGYATLKKYLCTEFGIRCEVQSSSVFDANGECLGGHENNSVYIEDEKYGIKGWYYSDACWDSVKKGNEDKKFYNYCLIPVTDVDKIKHGVVDISNYNPTSLLYGKQSSRDFLSKQEQDEIHNDCFNMSMDAIYDDTKREKAYNTLIELLKEYQVPADIYVHCKDKKIPEECSISNMVANVFLGDVLSVRSAIEHLKAIAQAEADGGIHYSLDTNIFDIYEKLETKKGLIYKSDAIAIGAEDDVAKFNQLKQQYYKCLHDGQFDEAHDALKQVKQLPVERKEVKIKRDKAEVVLFYQAEKDAIYHKLIDIRYDAIFYLARNEMLETKPISIDAFKKALKEVYRAEGVSEDMLDNVVEQAIKNTVQRAELRFTKEAQNCFKQQAIKDKRWSLKSIFGSKKADDEELYV